MFEHVLLSLAFTTQLSRDLFTHPVGGLRILDRGIVPISDKYSWLEGQLLPLHSAVIFSYVIYKKHGALSTTPLSVTTKASKIARLLGQKTLMEECKNQFTYTYMVG